MKDNFLFPTYDDGRIFLSPILGCNGGCKYCYLEMKDFTIPRINPIPTKCIIKNIKSIPEFVSGKNGTIISIGAWGDIFPREHKDLRDKAINQICEVLSIGNPVQIMSKYPLDEQSIEKICSNVMFQNQLLYSTTITTVNKWNEFETNTGSPIERLETCELFHKYNVPSNILIKPFLFGITDVEIDEIINLLVEYKIDYCVIGVLYWDDKINKKMSNNKLSEKVMKISKQIENKRHLDCNSNIYLPATDVFRLRKYCGYLRNHGIKAFLKSSCVSSNILERYNLSGYYNSDYCISCGNCSNS